MTERRADEETRDRIEEIRAGYRHWSRRTIAILSLLVVVQLGLGILSVSLVGRQGKAEDNARRIDRIVCAQTRYLERGLTLTGLDPNQSIVHDELGILLDELRPLGHCAPGPPLVIPPGPTPGRGAWENP